MSDYVNVTAYRADDWCGICSDLVVQHTEIYHVLKSISTLNLWKAIVLIPGVDKQLPCMHTLSTSDTLSQRFQAVSSKHNNNWLHSAVLAYDMSEVSSPDTPHFH